VEQISPDQEWGAFADGRRTRNEYSGEIPGFNVFDLAAVLALTREVQLNAAGTFYARPELTLALGLTPVARDLSWSPHAAQFGIGFFYRPP
jgi:hypothetical protein